VPVVSLDGFQCLFAARSAGRSGEFRDGQSQLRRAARPDLAKRYNIRVLPSFVWMNAGGDEIGRHDGFLPAPECAQWLRNNR